MGQSTSPRGRGERRLFRGLYTHPGLYTDRGLGADLGANRGRKRRPRRLASNTPGRFLCVDQLTPTARRMDRARGDARRTPRSLGGDLFASERQPRPSPRRQPRSSRELDLYTRTGVRKAFTPSERVPSSDRAMPPQNTLEMLRGVLRGGSRYTDDHTAQSLSPGDGTVGHAARQPNWGLECRPGHRRWFCGVGAGLGARHSRQSIDTETGRLPSHCPARSSSAAARASRFCRTASGESYAARPAARSLPSSGWSGTRACSIDR